MSAGRRWPGPAGISIVVAVLLAPALGGPVRAQDGALSFDAVRSCPDHGPNFVRIAGSDGCVRISGRVRAEATAGTKRASRDDIAGLGASGRVTLDARTNTELGPLRGVLSLKAGTGPRARD